MEIFSFSGRHWPVESSSSNDPLTWPLLAVGTGRCDMRNESPHRSPSIFEVIYKTSKPLTIPYYSILFQLFQKITTFSEDLRLWQLVQPKKRSPFCGARGAPSPFCGSRWTHCAPSNSPVGATTCFLQCLIASPISIDQVLQVGFKCFKISSKLQISIPIQL